LETPHRKKKKDFATTTFLPQKKEVSSATQKAIALSFARTNERTNERRRVLKEQERHLFLRDDLCIDDNDDEERKRERAICQPTF
tara:strand:- start:1172 stop:1426 length:255 start_codon:yes stop_codon:yes gene_type:complete